MVSGHHKDRNRWEEGPSGRKVLNCSLVEVGADHLLASWVPRSLLVGDHTLRDLEVGRNLHGQVGRTRLFLVRDRSHHRKHLSEDRSHHHVHGAEVYLHGRASVGCPWMVVSYRTHQEGVH